MSEGERPVRVAGYARYSREKERGTTVVTIETQEAEIRRVCGMHGWEFVRLYKDEAESGGKGLDEKQGEDGRVTVTLSRPGLAELVAGAWRLEFDRVLVYNASRLAREPWIFWFYLHQLEKVGVTLATCQFAEVDSSMAMFPVLAGVEEGVAAFTLREGTATTRRSMRRLAQKGIYARGEPLGYHISGSSCMYVREPSEEDPIPKEKVGLHRGLEEGEKGKLVPDKIGMEVLKLLEMDRETTPKEVQAVVPALTYDQAFKVLNSCRKYGRGG